VPDQKINTAENILTTVEKPLKPKIQQLENPVVVDEDKSDIAHFVKHTSIAITHVHSGNLKMHTHYECEQLGNFCYICFNKIVGSTICEGCLELFS
jgi:hypothetical protein